MNKLLFTLVVAAVGFAVGFLTGNRSAHQPVQAEVTDSTAVSYGNLAAYADDLPASEMDARLVRLCTATLDALRVHSDADELGRLHVGRLDEFPEEVLARNKEIVADSLIQLLRSPLSQNALSAQKAIYRNINSDWGLDLAKRYVSDFEELDFNAGSHRHPLDYFLNKASMEGSPELMQSAGYTEFVAFVLAQAASESPPITQFPNTEIVQRFVEQRTE